MLSFVIPEDPRPDPTGPIEPPVPDPDEEIIDDPIYDDEPEIIDKPPIERTGGTRPSC